MQIQKDGNSSVSIELKFKVLSFVLCTKSTENGFRFITKSPLAPMHEEAFGDFSRCCGIMRRRMEDDFKHIWIKIQISILKEFQPFTNFLQATGDQLSLMPRPFIVKSCLVLQQNVFVLLHVASSLTRC